MKGIVMFIINVNIPWQAVGYAEIIVVIVGLFIYWHTNGITNWEHFVIIRELASHGV